MHLVLTHLLQVYEMTRRSMQMRCVFIVVYNFTAINFVLIFKDLTDIKIR